MHHQRCPARLLQALAGCKQQALIGLQRGAALQPGWTKGAAPLLGSPSIASCHVSRFQSATRPLKLHERVVDTPEPTSYGLLVCAGLSRGV